jgi:hypothetical protein
MAEGDARTDQPEVDGVVVDGVEHPGVAELGPEPLEGALEAGNGEPRPRTELDFDLARHPRVSISVGDDEPD